MAFFTPRHATAALLAVLAAVACSSSGEELPPDKITEPPTPQPVGDADAGTPPSADVTVRFVDRWGFALGTPTEVPLTKRPRSATILLGGGDAPKKIEGTFGADGVLVFRDVPNEPYVLDLRDDVSAEEPPRTTRYAMPATVRKIRFGGDHWPRRDAAAWTPTTKLGLSVGVPATLKEQDELELFGLRSNYYRTLTYYSDVIEDQTNVPAADATETKDWTIADAALEGAGLDANGLPSNGDDLKIVQSRKSTVTRPGDRFVPWSSFTRADSVGVLDVATPAFVPGATNVVTGTLAAPPQKSFTIDVKGASFAPLKQAAPFGARAVARVTLSHETGSGPGYYVAPTSQSWTFSAVSRPNATVPECFPPDKFTCVQSQCPVPCASASDGNLDPGDVTYTFDGPQMAPAGTRPVYDFEYTYARTLLKVGNALVTMSADARILRPQSGTSASFSLELGPVRNLAFVDADGKPFAVRGDELFPTTSNVLPARIRFEPPTLGTPEYYEVLLLQLATETSGSNVVVARIFTRDTTVPVPSGILQAKRHYYARVYAVRDGRDWSAPNLYAGETSIRTGAASDVLATE